MPVYDSLTSRSQTPDPEARGSDGADIDPADLRSPGQRFLTRISELLDEAGGTSRNDLRYRLADALERGLDEEATTAALLVPSLRTVSRELGIHRKTVTAACELLVERGSVVRLPDGRFAKLSTPARDDENLASGVDELLDRAAVVALREQLSQTEFAERASRAIRRAASRRRRVVLVAPSERIPGMDAETLEELLKQSVQLISLEDVTLDPEVLYVATSLDIAAVRSQLKNIGDTFTIGLSFDADIRIASANLPEKALVSVIAPDQDILAAVARRLATARPDVAVVTSTRADPELLERADVILALDGVAVPAGAIPVARFACAVSQTEMMLLRAKLASTPWTEAERARRSAEPTFDTAESLASVS